MTSLQKALLASLMALCIVTCAWAQGEPRDIVLKGKISLVNGRIVDKPIELRLLSSAGEEIQIIMSDANGFFEFHHVMPGNYRVVAEPLGYQRTEVPVLMPPISRGAFHPEYSIRVMLKPVAAEGEPTPSGVVRSTDLSIPEAAKKHFEKGSEQAEKQRWDKSLGEFQKALEISPDYFRAAVYSGVALGKLKRLPEARERLKQAVGLCPDCPDAYLAMCEVERDNGHDAEALEALLQGQQRLPKDPAILFEACRIQFDHHNLQAAQSLCQMSHDAAPKHNPEVHLLLAKIFAAAKAGPQFIEQLQVYVKEAPGTKTAEMIRKQLEQAKQPPKSAN